MKLCVICTAVIPLCLGGALLGIACVSAGGYPNEAATAAYAGAQLACVDMADARAAADKCRVAIRAQFCSEYPAIAECRPVDGGSRE